MTERPPESVWDYPRPPRLEAVSERVEIDFGGLTIAATDTALRCLETSHPPVYYLPRAAFLDGVLAPSSARRTLCEFKGRARYLDIRAGGKTAVAAAWDYPDPTPSFAPILDHLAVYPAAMDACRVDGETVQAQEGDFYGGWITSWIKGPFKGGPGTWGW
jgi:uncharacterized protein (DUF427 family)